MADTGFSREDLSMFMYIFEELFDNTEEERFKRDIICFLAYADEKWPSNEEMDNIAMKFNDMGTYEFSGIIGAVDGTHIRIEPPSENPQAYFNRKKIHSLILQGVCTSDMKLIHVNIGWPGRVHDAKFLRNSDLWNTGFEKCRYGRFHILGDGAYPIKVWLLTPYRDTGHLTRNQTKFNKSLSSKRQVIERAFGLLKGRFRRLKYINKRSIVNMCTVIQSVCILHNMCICNGEDLAEFLETDVNDDDDVHVVQFGENDAEGTLKRINMTNRL
ncbi:putative nuclease HARBI1 [Pecten maximus]|uniref:putative nuclease HARBI1 n=1 Tax=Pecten maximus TaxID=6579 RepID=UPI0014591A2E|nr:putative nuclease HARBI1 [Pecten maximus]